jgi:hypothetical protein
VITTDQLDSLLPTDVESLSLKSGRSLSLSANEISHLRRGTEPGLVFTLRRILGKASDLGVQLGL